MRVWDFPPDKLCNKHLIAQHHELHCIYNIIMRSLEGFSHHPEVVRWHGRRASIVGVHDLCVDVMLKRGFKHKSPMELDFPIWFWPESWQSTEKQLQILKEKGCGCYERITGE
jgi:hypothetical protein